MAALKLTIATSLCTKPYKLAHRTTTTTTTAAAAAAVITPHASLFLNNHSNRNWSRIAACAPHLSFFDAYNSNYSNYANASIKNNNINNNNYYCYNCSYYYNYNYFLGFVPSGHNSLYFFYRNAASSSSSAQNNITGGFSGSESSTASGSGLVADMGSGDKANDVDWFRNGDALNAQNQMPSPSAPNHYHRSKFLTLPTVLTLGRVAAVPFLVYTFYVHSWWGSTATTSVFIAAAITDWLDGYLARKMRLGSAFGAFLDPVADKLMVAATLVLLCTIPFEVAMFGQVPWLLTVPAIAIIGREITMSAVREWAASQDGKLFEAVAVNNLGKWKTATQMTALTILLATRDSSIAAPGILVAAGVVLLYISAGLSVWSLAVYMSKIWRVLLK